VKVDQACNAANLEWLAETFEEAKSMSSPGMMLVIQANPFEEDTATPSGFTQFKAALEDEVSAFDGPVVLVHGDSHTFLLALARAQTSRPSRTPQPRPPHQTARRARLTASTGNQDLSAAAAEMAGTARPSSLSTTSPAQTRAS
jgi:hypothetical protein